MNLRETLAEDAAWYGGGILRALPRKTFRVVMWLRLCQHAPWGMRHALSVILYVAAQNCGVELWPSTKVGPGLKLTHAFSTVINPKAVLGRDVVVMHGVTVGQSGREGRAPVIGDRVLLGPGCVILGDVRIGDGATISANCVVTQDVPPDTLVHGGDELVMKPHVRPFGKYDPAPA